MNSNHRGPMLLVALSCSLANLGCSDDSSGGNADDNGGAAGSKASGKAGAGKGASGSTEGGASGQGGSGGKAPSGGTKPTSDVAFGDGPDLSELAIDEAALGPLDGRTLIVPREFVTTPLSGAMSPTFASNGQLAVTGEGPPRISTIDTSTGTPLIQYPLCQDLFTRAMLLAPTADGTVYYAVRVELNDVGTVFDYQLAKVSPSGEIVWTKTLGAGEDFSALPQYLRLHDDGVVLFGAASGSVPDLNDEQGIHATDSSSYPFVAKYAEDGEREWLTEVPDETGFETVAAVAAVPGGAVYLQNDSLWCKIQADGTPEFCTVVPFVFDSVGVQESHLLLGVSSEDAIFFYATDDETLPWSRTVAPLAKAVVNESGTEWSATIEGVATHATRDYLFVTGTASNTFEVKSGFFYHRKTDFVARIDTAGELLWYRQFVFAPAQSADVAPTEVDEFDDRDGYEHFNIRALGENDAGEVVVAGTSDRGLLSFSLDPDTGALLAAPGREVVDAQVADDFEAGCFPAACAAPIAQSASQVTEEIHNTPTSGQVPAGGTLTSGTYHVTALDWFQTTECAGFPASTSQTTWQVTAESETSGTIASLATDALETRSSFSNYTTDGPKLIDKDACSWNDPYEYSFTATPSTLTTFGVSDCGEFVRTFTKVE